jgi:hypothetical protein
MYGLNYLHLPNQSYENFFTMVSFIKDGQICNLEDATDFVSSPPPVFAIYTLPTSLKDMRPGDEQNVQIQVKSFTVLPFDLSLSADSTKDLELNLKPDKTSGIPDDITSSTLHIRVLRSNSAQAYTLPISIHANMVLTPRLNLNNSTSSQITKFSNITVTVLPPLNLWEKIIGPINMAWNGVGSAINGFVGLVTAIIGIGGLIGGWFLRKFRTKKNYSFD